MKKIVVAVLVAICLAGVGFLGYVIFQSKNIASVEIAGNVQSLYVIGEDLNFGDAKLKVTYRNGSIKMVDMNTKSVKVTMFSTSETKHGTMKITYKSQTLEQEYNVIKRGYYYLSKSTITTQTGTIPSSSNSLAETKEIIYIGDRGIIKYYDYVASKWYLRDGAYDTSYRYTIVGDTMNISLGVNNKIEMKAQYDQEGIRLVSTLIQRSNQDSDIIVKKEEKLYNFYSTSNLVANTVSVDYSKVYERTIEYNGKQTTYLQFKVGDMLETSANSSLLLEVRYIDQDPNFPIRKAYVYVCDEIVDDELRTGNVTGGGLNQAYCFYEGKEFDFFYSVVNR